MNFGRHLKSRAAMAIAVLLNCALLWWTFAFRLRHLEQIREDRRIVFALENQLQNTRLASENAAANLQESLRQTSPRLFTSAADAAAAITKLAAVLEPAKFHTSLKNIPLQQTPSPLNQFATGQSFELVITSQSAPSDPLIFIQLATFLHSISQSEKSLDITSLSIEGNGENLKSATVQIECWINSNS